MRVAGEINTRKNIYTKKLLQRSYVFLEDKLYLVRRRNVYVFVRLLLNHIIKASVTVIEPRQVSMA